MERLAIAYNVAVASATGDDVHIGSASTRVADFVNRGPEFDDLYIFSPLLEACRCVIGRPFKLSSFHSRTLRPDTPAEELHVDVKRYSADWPLLSFILMVDEFRPDNGATRFVPGSHLRPGKPADSISDGRADHPGQALACGPAGSLLIFNGSAWHGHTANTSSCVRRSLQGAFIPRDGLAGTSRDSGHWPGRYSLSDQMLSYVLNRFSNTLTLFPYAYDVLVPHGASFARADGHARE